MWEFPGGKIAEQEGAGEALRRELLEELGIVAVAVDTFMKLHHEYPDRSVSIEFFLVTSWENDVQGLEGQQLEWVNVADINPDRLLPADLPVIERLTAL
jgi:8-oxo-dGTP diphosphatase